MSLLQLIPDISPTDVAEEIPDLVALHGDPVLGFARVISLVKGNTRQFRGWGPHN